MKEIGRVFSETSGRTDDSARTLNSLRFQTGDFIDVSIRVASQGGPQGGPQQGQPRGDGPRGDGPRDGPRRDGPPDRGDERKDRDGREVKREKVSEGGAEES